LENTQARQLTELYRALRLYVNCFQPSMKLLSKERDLGKIFGGTMQIKWDDCCCVKGIIFSDSSTIHN
jgi:hypothetical protein